MCSFRWGVWVRQWVRGLTFPTFFKWEIVFLATILNFSCSPRFQMVRSALLIIKKTARLLLLSWEHLPDLLGRVPCFTMFILAQQTSWCQQSHVFLRACISIIESSHAITLSSFNRTSLPALWLWLQNRVYTMSTPFVKEKYPKIKHRTAFALLNSYRSNLTQPYQQQRNPCSGSVGGASPPLSWKWKE